MFYNRPFDLPKLDPVSTDLYLRIDPANILNVSIAFHAHHITGPVKAFVFLTCRERIFHKCGSCLFREIMVSSCDLPSGMAQLTGSAYRKSAHGLFVHDIAADICLGFSDRYVFILFINEKFCR